MRTIAQRGRPKKPGGPLVQRKIGIPPVDLDALEELAGEDKPEDKIPAMVREAISEYLARKDGLVVDPDSDPVEETALPYLTAAPAGHWEEAVRGSGKFVLSNQTAEEMGVRDGDVVVRVNGESMEGAGIPDGALLVMRKIPNDRPPKRGRKVLVQIIRGEDEDDVEYESTIKTWISSDELRDGNNEVFPLPAKTRQVTPIAVAIGMIATFDWS